MKNYFVIFILVFSKSVFAQHFAAIVSQEIGKEYIINEKEDTLFYPPQGMNLKTITDGIVRIHYKGHYGYVDCHGKEIIPARYERAEDFFENFARVRINGNWGYINKKGDVVIPAIYKHVFDFNEGRAVVKKDGKMAIIDTTGKLITKFEFDDALSFSCNRAWVKKDGKWGAITRNGVMIIQPTYVYTQRFSEGYAAVKKEDLMGYVDTLNNFLIPFDDRNKQNYYSDIISLDQFPEGIFPKTLDRGFYYIEPDRTYYSYYSDSLLRYFNGKFGFINKHKTKVIAPQFNQATSFYKGYAIVLGGSALNGFSAKSNIINTRGEKLLKEDYLSIWSVYNDIAICSPTLLKREYIDLKGRFIFKNKYLRANAFSEIK